MLKDFEDKHLILGIESIKDIESQQKQFSGAAHVSQILTLLPDEKDSETNLKIGKGIAGFVKVSEQAIEVKVDNKIKNIIRQKPVSH